MPLSFDMPFEKLLKYTGTNPRPEDFDAYWDESLAEQRAVDPQPELVPAAFQVPFAECFDLFFTGVGGARLHAKLVQPRHAPGAQSAQGAHPALLMFHGYSGNCGDWLDKLGYAGLGYTLAALDVRGQAGLSQDPGGHPGMAFHGQILRGMEGQPKDLMFRSIFLDTAQLARVVMALDHVDPARVGATGTSQGGGLTLACAALVPQIKMIAPVYPFLSDYRRVWEIDLDVDAYSEVRDWFRWRDPLHRRETEFFTRLGYIDVQHLAPRIQAEVYMAVGLRDKTCPPSTQFAAYNKIRSKKRLEIYPDYGHENLRGHGDLIMQYFLRL